ncbi:MAG: type II secretion system protein M [Gallionellaceae bacterium]|nr:MAG: type II secretion system protein M [Gallionellaceae bacterium]
MKTRWQELRSKHWSGRPAQERRMIVWAAAVLLPVVYYFLLWQPAHRTVAKLHETLPVLQAQAAKLNDEAAEVDALRHRPQLAALDAAALKTSVEESAQRHQLRTAINTLEIQESNGVRVTCDAISFTAWMAWLRDLQQEQHIRADSISISALPQTGMVKISATLSNGNVQ